MATTEQLTPSGDSASAPSDRLASCALPLSEEALDEIAAGLIVPDRTLEMAIRIGMDTSEIAERFGCDEDTARALLARAGLRQSGFFSRVAG